MHSNERRVADIAPPPDPKRDLATVQSNPAPGREALNPFHFSERLFR